MAGTSRGNHPQHGIHGVSRVLQFHSDLGNCDRLEAAEALGEVDCVFFGSDEAIGLPLIAQFLQGLNVARAIAVMIAKDHFAGRFNPSHPKLGEKQRGLRYSAKDNRAGG